MSMPLFPPSAELLFTQHMNPGEYTLCGNIPSQYPFGIGIYIANNDPYATVMSQVIITRHSVANEANVFNQTMYIPAQNVANLSNFANIAGLNVFVKTTGTKVTVFIIHTSNDNGDPQRIDVTPQVVNMNQSITPMPAPMSSTSNSMGTQILQLKGLVNTLQNTLTIQQQDIQTLQTQVQFLQTSLNSLK